jgi:hypothetical protein
VSRLFLSHSSENNAEAAVLRDWLNRAGWDDVFLDTDPERDMAGGVHWERALNQAAHRCEAVLFVVSRAWLASGRCLKEFNLAHGLNKRLFGLLIEDIATAELPSNLAGAWQIVRLASDPGATPASGDGAPAAFSTERLARLKSELQRVALDPRSFAWPPQDNPNRPPYRGLRPLEVEDAGIFFGRDGSIIEALDRLRGLHDQAPPRFLVVLGESGVGKSSFMRAGLLPRLARDDRNFLPLPVLRPRNAAILGGAGLVRSIEVAFQARNLAYPRADIRAAVDGGAPTLLPLLAKLVRAPASGSTEEPEARPPVLVLPIDQGEELFLVDGRAEAERLLALVRHLLLAAAPGIAVLVTMHSDSYERLRTAKALEGIRQETLSLAPMPRAAYQMVIEGPLDRLKDGPRALTIEPALIQALLADMKSIGEPDALPLLAFALERLYLQYPGSRRRTLADYHSLGPIGSSIETAADRALALAKAFSKVPRESAARLLLVRRALIPWFAGIDLETQSPRCRLTRVSEIPSEARRLIRRLIEYRLLATDVAQDTGEVAIELAHESVLRQWGLLRGWLNEDIETLLTLESVKDPALDRTANRRPRAWFAQTRNRLEEVGRLKGRDDPALHPHPAERDYLARRQQRDNATRSAGLRGARERKNLLRFRWALIAFFVASMATVGTLMVAMNSENASQPTVTSFQNTPGLSHATVAPDLER